MRDLKFRSSVIRLTSPGNFPSVSIANLCRGCAGGVPESLPYIMARHVADLSLTQRRGSMKCADGVATPRSPSRMAGRPASRFAICERKRNYQPNGERAALLLFTATVDEVIALAWIFEMYRSIIMIAMIVIVCAAHAYLMPQSIMRRLVAMQLLNMHSWPSYVFSEMIKNIKARSDIKSKLENLQFTLLS